MPTIPFNPPHAAIVAEAAARAGAAVLLEYFGRSDLVVHQKSALDPVTVADSESERAIVTALRAAFPHDAIVGEEGSGIEGNRGRVWYVDPLDGTFNFTRSIPFWCVSVGLVDDGQPAAGVVFDPLVDEAFVAWRGGGVWLNQRPVYPSAVEEPMAAVVQMNVDFARETMGRSLHDLHAVAPRVMRVRNLGALALSLVYLASGRLDAVVQRAAHSWDYAGGLVALGESGAIISGLDGEPFDLSQDDALAAATPALHRQLRDMLAGYPA